MPGRAHVTTSQAKNTIRENTSRDTHNVVAEMLFAEDNIRKVCDLPCGHGAFTNRLIDQGIEVKAGDCANILEVPEADFVGCDMNEPLPFEDKQFDALVCIDGIEHIKRPFDFIGECRRVIREKGILIISTPNISALRSRWRWLLTGFHNKCKHPLDETRPSPLHHINMLSFPNLRYLLHTNGFQITSIRTNRIKGISYAYLPLAPVSYMTSLLTFRKEEKNPALRKRNAEVLGQMFSAPVLFGETLIVKAFREQ